VILKKLVLGPLQANCYILADEKTAQAIIIDPGAEAQRILDFLKKNKLKAAFVINTHGHIDHIGADEELAAPIYIHKKDLPLLKDTQMNFSKFLGFDFRLNTKDVKMLEDNAQVGIDNIILQVRHIPGHTPGGIALLLKGHRPEIIFSGDSLFWHSIGRTDLPYSSEEDLLKAIKEKILTLSDETIIYPGHGPETTVGEERRKNPFLKSDA